jgi:kynurenine 3-monooxygenase
MFHEHQFVSFKGPDTAVFVSGSKELISVRADLFIGADGAFSAVRSFIVRQSRANAVVEHSPFEYVEMVLSSKDLRRDAFHTWVSKDALLLAMPTRRDAQTFSASLFFSSAVRTAVLSDPVSWTTNSIPDIGGTLSKKEPVVSGSMVTVMCSTYCHSNVVLIGDAAHAMVPFAGQGANSALEDCQILVKLLCEHYCPGGKTSVAELLQSFFIQRKEDMDAIACFARHNFDDMRLAGGNQLRKRLLPAVHNIWPSLYKPPHVDINFTKLSYARIISTSNKQATRVELIFWSIVLVCSIAIATLYLSL